MGRYRKPQPRGSCYITVEGEAALREELRILWKEERPIVTAAVSEAAKQGDRSENGDYIYGKRRLAEIDRRVRYLNKRLDELNVVSELPACLGKIYFGAWVELEDEQEIRRIYRIVGPDEFNLAQGKLSMDSPLAKALLGKQLHDEISITIGGDVSHYIITAISYQPPGACSN
ncbi:MAG: transcription elongation factor GreB [Pseudomonadales bacterium]